MALTHWFILQESVPQSTQLIVIVINDLTLWIVWNRIYVINGSVKNLMQHVSAAHFVINSRLKFGNLKKLDTCALVRDCYHIYVALSLTYISISYTWHASVQDVNFHAKIDYCKWVYIVRVFLQFLPIKTILVLN